MENIDFSRSKNEIRLAETRNYNVMELASAVFDFVGKVETCLQAIDTRLSKLEAANDALRKGLEKLEEAMP